MANFGFRSLAVVSPWEPHWREARSAIGAPDLLQNAKATESLAEAVADCTLVLGTGTLTYRKPEQPVVPLPALGPRIARSWPAAAASGWSSARKSTASPAKTSPIATCWSRFQLTRNNPP